MPAFYHVVERFDIHAPRGAIWQGWLLSPPHRPTGRRIIVTADTDGKTVLFDTDAHVDLGNATNALNLWLAQQYEAAGQPLPQGV